jgi:hypothetical protein
MTEITTTEGFYTSTLDDSKLDDVKEALKSDNELIGYSHDELSGSLTVILDLSDIAEGKLDYIH